MMLQEPEGGMKAAGGGYVRLSIAGMVWIGFFERSELVDVGV